jgi:hypothetical protein
MRRRGALLLELLLSVALFTMCALVILSVATDVLSSVESARRRQEAVDVARTVLASLEAGLATVQNVDDLVQGERAEGGPLDEEDRRWQIDVETEPSQFPGLTVVTVIVRDLRGADPLAANTTLRNPTLEAPEAFRLVELLDIGEVEEEEGFEIDPLDEEGV